MTPQDQLTHHLETLLKPLTKEQQVHVLRHLKGVFAALNAVLESALVVRS